MTNDYPYEHFRKQVQPALQSKLEEFQLLGYERITEEEIWQFLNKKRWKKSKGKLKLFTLIDDILSIKAGDFFSFSTVEALKEEEFVLDNEDELRKLLK